MNFNDMLKKKNKDNPSKEVPVNPEVLNEVTIDSETTKPVLEDEVLNEDLNAPSALEIVKEELALANDKYLRLFAEFDNFRRRTIKEREDARKLEGKDLIVSLLSVLDDFERAAKAMENVTDVAPVKEGLVIVQNKLKNILIQKGLKAMDSIGSTFDPELQEAITNVPAPNEELKGKVIDEMEKGYFLNDKVIRFAKVIVGS